MTETLVKWFAFRVALGFLPIGMNILRISTESGPSSLTLDALFARGELLLIACAVAGGAIGELTAAPKRFPVFRLWSMWGSAVTITSSAYWYAYVRGLVETNTTYDAHFVTIYSVLLYAFVLFAALGCVVISELSKSVLPQGTSTP